MRKAAITLALAGTLALGASVAALADDDYGYGNATTQATSTAYPQGTSGETYSFKATLSKGLEVPKPNAPAGAKGSFTAKSVEGAKIAFTWKLSFSGLSGNAVAAHIHKGKPGTAGPVVLPLCGPCRSGQAGKASVSKAIEELMEKGQAYVNVHTKKNAAGEIRGQVKLVG